MNKNQIINKVIGLTMVFGSFIMLIIYYLVDWGVCAINLPKIPANMWLVPIWIGGVISLYRPNLSKTAKVLSWAAFALFVISLPMVFLERGSWIHSAGEIAMTTSGLPAIFAWMKISKENQSFNNEKDEDSEDDKN